MNFEKYAAQGNQFVNEVAVELRRPKERDRVARVVRATLHGLRARLTMDESFQLLAQLPMVLKAVYVDGWRPLAEPDKHIKTPRALADEVMLADGGNAARDLPSVAEAEEAISAVFRVLKRHISAGEVTSLAHTLPRSLERMWLDA
jgi:uncharacterized protein (DUF2267 family)